MLSKKTIHKQEGSCEAIERWISAVLVDATHSRFPKRPEPGCGDPGRNGGVNGGKIEGWLGAEF